MSNTLFIVKLKLKITSYSIYQKQHILISILDVQYSNVRKVGTNISNMKDDADRARI